MKEKLERPSFWAGFLTLVSVALVSPRLWHDGLNIVTRTYHEAAQAFAAGTSLYVKLGPRVDYYKYSPLFAWFYEAFAALPERAEVLLWGALNTAIFWWGLSRWFPRRFSWLLLVGIVLSSMELMGSLHYQQINALLAGGMVGACALYRERRFVSAAFVLALLTNIKVFPLAVALALCCQFEGRFVGAFFASSVLYLVLPALSLGWTKNWAFHQEWLGVLRLGSGQGLLDLETVAARLGFGLSIAKALRLSVLALSAFALSASLYWTRVKRRSFSWSAWLALALTFMVLVNPRTESPTFVVMAPAYFFLLEEILELKSRALAWICYGVGAFLTTLSFNDLWPKAIFNPLDYHYLTKTLGVLVLWILSLALLARRQSARQTATPAD